MSDDWLYFKFKLINKHLIESLVSPNIYFTKPDLLNAPFDCQLDLRKSFSRAVGKAHGTRKTALQAALLEQICFGLRTPPTDIELISKLAKEYSGCSKFCKAVHADTDFGMSVVEL